MGSCVETAALRGCAPTHKMTKEEIPGKMCFVFLFICFLFNDTTSFMVMDESSCVEMEQEECGICHTVYMKECKMKMAEEMMPTKVTTCKNVTRYENKCQKVMEHRMVEEKRPICKVELMAYDHTKCKNLKSQKCKRVMKCNIGMKRMKKEYPTTACEKVVIGEEEKCFEMVKLKKEMHEAEKCSFHPKTICKNTEGMECKRVAKKMCDYIEQKR